MNNTTDKDLANNEVISWPYLGKITEGLEKISVKVILEICALLGYYAASCGNFFTDVSGKHIGLSRKVGKQLPHEKSSDVIKIASEA
jgi:hypothetical protein